MAIIKTKSLVIIGLLVLPLLSWAQPASTQLKSSNNQQKMENKIETKFICLSEPAFFELLDTLYERLKGGGKEDRWINSEIAMKKLNISSPTTLQQLRDTGAIRFSQYSRKQILYDKESIEEYLELHANRKGYATNRK